MAYQYALSEDQIKKFEEWSADKQVMRTAIGGAFTFTFTPTSLGYVVKAYFLMGSPAEQSIDLTNYDNW